MNQQHFGAAKSNIFKIHRPIVVLLVCGFESSRSEGNLHHDDWNNSI